MSGKREICLFGKTEIQLPVSLLEHSNIFHEVISLNTWKALSPSQRQHLMKFLPTFPSHDHEEKLITLQRLFSGQNFYFGNPLQNFHTRLKEGRFVAEVVKLNSMCRRAKYAEYKYQQQHYYYQLLQEILINRQNILEATRNQIPLSCIQMEPPYFQPSKEPMRMQEHPLEMRVRRRYFQVLQDVNRECSVEDLSSDEDNEFVKPTKFHTYSDLGESCIGSVLPTWAPKTDLLFETPESAVLKTLSPVAITDTYYKDLLRKHRKRRYSSFDHPELDTANVTIEELVMRTQPNKRSRFQSLLDNFDVFTVKTSAPTTPSVSPLSPEQSLELTSIKQEVQTVKEESTNNDEVCEFGVHAHFFSLLRNLIGEEPEARITTNKLEEKLREWLQSKSCAVNDWFLSHGNWVELCLPALKFLSGDIFGVSLENFVPYLDFKERAQQWKWIGQGRDTDTELEPVYTHWLQQRLLSPIDQDESLAQTIPPPRCPTKYTVTPSTADEKAFFKEQERVRFENPHRAFTYYLHGYESIVGPIKGIYNNNNISTKAREHAHLIKDRPPYVTILTLVRDSAARLPNGEGTRADICVLLRDSQFLADGVSDAQINTVVSGALDRLHYEKDPCVKYDIARKLWIYLHRNRSEDEFQRMHLAQGAAAKAKKALLKPKPVKKLKDSQSSEEVEVASNIDVGVFDSGLGEASLQTSSTLKQGAGRLARKLSTGKDKQASNSDSSMKNNTGGAKVSSSAQDSLKQTLVHIQNTVKAQTQMMKNTELTKQLQANTIQANKLPANINHFTGKKGKPPQDREKQLKAAQIEADKLKASQLQASQFHSNQANQLLSQLHKRNAEQVNRLKQGKPRSTTPIKASPAVCSPNDVPQSINVLNTGPRPVTFNLVQTKANAAQPSTVFISSQKDEQNLVSISPKPPGLMASKLVKITPQSADGLVTISPQQKSLPSLDIKAAASSMAPGRSRVTDLASLSKDSTSLQIQGGQIMAGSVQRQLCEQSGKDNRTVAMKLNQSVNQGAPAASLRMEALTKQLQSGSATVADGGSLAQQLLVSTISQVTAAGGKISVAGNSSQSRVTLTAAKPTKPSTLLLTRAGSASFSNAQHGEKIQANSDVMTQVLSAGQLTSANIASKPIIIGGKPLHLSGQSLQLLGKQAHVGILQSQQGVVNIVARPPNSSNVGQILQPVSGAALLQAVCGTSASCSVQGAPVYMQTQMLNSNSNILMTQIGRQGSHGEMIGAQLNNQSSSAASVAEDNQGGMKGQQRVLPPTSTSSGPQGFFSTAVSLQNISSSVMSVSQLKPQLSKVAALSTVQTQPLNIVAQTVPNAIPSVNSSASQNLKLSGALAQQNPKQQNLQINPAAIAGCMSNTGVRRGNSSIPVRPSNLQISAGSSTQNIQIAASQQNLQLLKTVLSQASGKVGQQATFVLSPQQPSNFTNADGTVMKNALKGKHAPVYARIITPPQHQALQVAAVQASSQVGNSVNSQIGSLPQGVSVLQAVARFPNDLATQLLAQAQPKQSTNSPSTNI